LALNVEAQPASATTWMVSVSVVTSQRVELLTTVAASTAVNPREENEQRQSSLAGAAAGKGDARRNGVSCDLLRIVSVSVVTGQR
jgi:hypothetical protein